MKLAFCQTNGWIGVKSGGLIAQRRCAEALAAAGHDVMAIVRLPDADFVEPQAQMDVLPASAEGGTHYRQSRTALKRLGIPCEELTGGIRFRTAGVDVYAFGGSLEAFCAMMRTQLEKSSPDWIHVLEEDDGNPFLSTCLNVVDRRVIVHMHSVQCLPFGPLNIHGEDPERAAQLRSARGAVTPSNFSRTYIERHGGISPKVFPPVTYDPTLRPNVGRFGEGFITTINPSAIKGIAIFIALARALPELRFAAIPTWATSQADLAALAGVPNISILAAEDDVSKIYRQTAVLLAPAIWEETFGLTAIEAMSYGLPVIASDLGGHREAKLGVDYLVPTAPLQIKQVGDARELVVPEPDISEWARIVARLFSDEREYVRVSTESHHAANEFIRTRSVQPFVQYMEQLSLG